MNKSRVYVGIDEDTYGGMTPTGAIVKDAWLFGILPENETCQGWTLDRIQALYDKVTEAWAPYGHLASRLPPELRERHHRIYDEAIERARAMGWIPPMEDD